MLNFLVPFGLTELYITSLQFRYSPHVCVVHNLNKSQKHAFKISLNGRKHKLNHLTFSGLNQYLQSCLLQYDCIIIIHRLMLNKTHPFLSFWNMEISHRVIHHNWSHVESCLCLSGSDARIVTLKNYYLKKKRGRVKKSRDDFFFLPPWLNSLAHVYYWTDYFIVGGPWRASGNF